MSTMSGGGGPNKLVFFRWRLLKEFDAAMDNARARYLEAGDEMQADIDMLLRRWRAMPTVVKLGYAMIAASCLAVAAILRAAR